MHAHQLVPPDVLTGVLLDCCGVEEGAWMLPELLLEELELLEELALPDESEPAEEPELSSELAEEPEVPESDDEPSLDDPVDDPVPADPVLVAPVLDPAPVLVAACVAPGSMSAITPAAAKLAMPTVAVVTLSLCRPRSRSAIAHERARAASRFLPWLRGGTVRNSGLLISASLSSPLVLAVEVASKNAMHFTAPRGTRPWRTEPGTAIMAP